MAHGFWIPALRELYLWKPSIMKTSLLSLLLLVSLIATATAKIHLTDTANRWVMEYSTIDLDHYLETIQLGNDTIIRGKTYKASFNNYLSRFYRHGYFREDTVADEVWGMLANTSYYAPDTVEHLIYKGSWQVGDSSSMQAGMLHITGIDSTEINGEQYKVFYGSQRIWASTIVIIEGIGCLKGLGLPIYPQQFEYTTSLLCYFHGSDKPILNPAIYHFDNTGSCTLGVLTTPSASQQVFVRPNPGSENMSLVLPAGMGTSSVIITDFSGRIMAQFETNTINTAIGQYLRAPGIYFYRVQEKRSGQSYQGRFVFQ